MNRSPQVDTAAAALRRGGVIAYPTEAVWGLGCDPFNEAAVMRLLALKQREVDKGLILIAADDGQLEGLVDWDSLTDARRAEIRASWPGPHTWVMPATARVPRWITGEHDGVAVRITGHPLAVRLCHAFGGALVSTSANAAGAPPPRTLAEADAALFAALDAVLEGDTGRLERPTPIRNALTGTPLRL